MGEWVTALNCNCVNCILFGQRTMLSRHWHFIITNFIDIHTHTMFGHINFTSRNVCVPTVTPDREVTVIGFRKFNPLKPELNPICYLLALLGAHDFLHVSRIKVKLLIFRLLMS